ncbi:DUF2806 domain-containing protein [Tenacibaculum piscium]|uniref:DUF2806 domain-containing protein n=1 Tax=Tenacibaculum piscium TaxID=1458515 RepID=UPI001F3E8944|nr:DUF2806 domain-containing protein [Tenacibaculum piscium]
MALNDFLGLGKVLPIDKLIDVMSNSVGRLSKSYFNKKDADTKAYEIKKIAEARAEEMRIMSVAVKENFQLTGGIGYQDEKISIQSPKEVLKIQENTDIPSIENSDIIERTENRLNYQATKKQLNIENIAAIAANELKDEKPIDNEPLDEDWTTRFFNIAEDISSEEMQALWARILAGEIKKPKSYSLRTLDLLKNLSKDEAESFMKFGQAKVSSGDKKFIYNPKGELLEKEFNITFEDVLLMKELGLIVSEKNLEISLNPTQQNKQTVFFICGSKCIVFNRNNNTSKQGIEVLAFTKTGTELSELIIQEPNITYLESICSKFKHENVDIEYGDLIENSNGEKMLVNKIKYDK